MFERKKAAKETLNDFGKEAGVLAGDTLSKNAQNSMDASLEGMDLLRDVAKRKYKVGFDQKKGNFFEYIEAAKYNRDAALKGVETRARVTAADGRPSDAADIELIKNGKVTAEVQCKFSDAEDAAAQSVHMQADEKYLHMRRQIRKDDNYISKKTGEKTTLLKESKRLAKEHSEKMPYKSDVYKDTYENLTDELSEDGATSGGTTLEETKAVNENPDRFAEGFEKEALHTEMRTTAINMAAASAITTGVISGITNLYQVYKDKKKLSEAVKDVCKDTGKSALRGAGTGALSAWIRYRAMKKGSFLSDSSCSTILASGLLDTGISLFSFARGEISSEELKDQIVESAGKTTATIFFTKAISAIGITTPFVPLTIYTSASFVMKSCKEIIKESKLKTEELNKLTCLAKESAKEMNKEAERLEKMISKCDQAQKKFFGDFVNGLDYDFMGASNYDAVLNLIVDFANRSGIVLQHATFEEFDDAMNKHETLVLKKNSA